MRGSKIRISLDRSFLKLLRTSTEIEKLFHLNEWQKFGGKLECDNLSKNLHFLLIF